MAEPKNPSADDDVVVEVRLLGREYRVACKERERKRLEQVVQDVQERARVLQAEHQLHAPDSVLLMMCLNMAQALDNTNTTQSQSVHAQYQQSLNSMCEKIDRVLHGDPEQLDIL